MNDAFHEILRSINADAKTFTCSIDAGPAVLSKDVLEGYIGEVTVLPITAHFS